MYGLIMNRKHPPLSLPHGMFRYLYYHYQVRYPQSVMRIVAGSGFLDAVEAIDELNLSANLVENSWLIGAARPDLADAVEALWDDMSPLSRGDYLAGRSEWANSECRGDEMPVASIMRLFNRDELIEFDADTACQFGCNLLALDGGNSFLRLLERDFDWTQEIERATESEKGRWNQIELLSGRVIDVFLEVALVFHREDLIEVILKEGADPNILVWQLERSYNSLYTALSYAIKEGQEQATKVLLEHGADASGSEVTKWNSPLSEAFRRGDQSLIEQLVANGASFQDGTRYEEAPGGYGWHRPCEWVTENLSDLVDFVAIDSKPLFMWPHAQGGSYYSLLDCLSRSPEKLVGAEKLGLDTRLTVHEMAGLIDDDGYEVFSELLGRISEKVRDEALSRVTKEWLEFGARGRFVDARPQEDRINEVSGFAPNRRFQIELSDGSIIHPYLDGIAGPNHQLGECMPNLCWVEDIECELRRRGDRVLVTEVRRNWNREELPKYAKKSRDFLPVIREFDGRFIWLGLRLGKVQWNLKNERDRDILDKFFDSEGFEVLEEETIRRIEEQRAANEKPREPVLPREDLEGYPFEFWPYLVRLDNGLIGMTDESCPDEERRSIYEEWARENKRELDFSPDTRCVEWPHWEWDSVPPELKPFFQWDNFFKQPGVRHAAENEYEEAMARKATNWWNNRFISAFRNAFPEQDQD